MTITISADTALLDVELIHRFLDQEYGWTSLSKPEIHMERYCADACLQQHQAA